MVIDESYDVNKTTLLSIILHDIRTYFDILKKLALMCSNKGATRSRDLFIEITARLNDYLTDGY